VIEFRSSCEVSEIGEKVFNCLIKIIRKNKLIDSVSAHNHSVWYPRIIHQYLRVERRQEEDVKKRERVSHT
jgi:hypothetical protein